MNIPATDESKENNNLKQLETYVSAVMFIFRVQKEHAKGTQRAQTNCALALKAKCASPRCEVQQLYALALKKHKLPRPLDPMN